MKRPSDPLLRWMRERMQERKISTAALAMSAGLPASRVRHVLSGQEPMTIDELLLFGKALDISPADFGGLPGAVEFVEEDDSENNAPRAASSTAHPFIREMETIDDDFDDELGDDDGDELSPAAAVDPFGNHPRQLIEIAFGLGCDFLFLARASDLTHSGVPEAVLRRYDNREIPIKLDAAYHQYNKPIYAEDTLALTLSFDALCECTFPWASIRQVIFFPVPPEAPAKKPELPPEKTGPKKPFLRLVE